MQSLMKSVVIYHYQFLVHYACNSLKLAEAALQTACVEYNLAMSVFIKQTENKKLVNTDYY